MQLAVYDVDMRDGTALIRLGKGKKDRMVPIGERACAWIEKYLYTIRPSYLDGEDHGVLFLAKHRRTDGRQTALGDRQEGHRAREPRGFKDTHPNAACHLFRHAWRPTCWRTAPTSATSRRCSATPISRRPRSTRSVSILKLKEVHAQTHPARLTRTGEAMLDSIAASLSYCSAAPALTITDPPNLEE